jgi:hypothetical protein
MGLFLSFQSKFLLTGVDRATEEAARGGLSPPTSVCMQHG